jgi:cytochrome c oxidase cbb3-type subunit I/II
MVNPRDVSPGTNMPAYPNLTEDKVDFAKTADKMRALRSVGVPYTPVDLERAPKDALAQSTEIAKDLEQNGVSVAPDAEIVALIAYLQRLGKAGSPPTPGGDAISLGQQNADARSQEQGRAE